MRLFGGDRITNMMDSLKIDENMPIENRILTSTIENAQSKIEKDATLVFVRTCCSSTML